VADPAPGSISAPQGVTGCVPEVRRATVTDFYLQNANKPNNFIIGELEPGGQLSFIVENLPKDGAGCPGKWLFDTMMVHFGATVTAIQGNWVSATTSDNLIKINQLTAGGSQTLKEAAKDTWTGKRAGEWGYLQVEVVEAVGTPGNYSKVRVLFKK
jgi:hypothetical protein